MLLLTIFTIKFIIVRPKTNASSLLNKSRSQNYGAIKKITNEFLSSAENYYIINANMTIQILQVQTMAILKQKGEFIHS